MNIKMKQHNLKKKIAFLLALSMISGCSGTVSFAEEVSDIIQTITDVKSKSVGKIDISLGSALLIGDTEFEVTLKGDNGFSEKDTVTVGDAAEGKISFSNLADGKYTITVKSDGFADYSQDIDVHGKMYSLRITTGFCGGYSYEKGSLHSGVILIGDVDNDGDIDNNDKDILIDVIDGNAIPENCITDLNHDGETNLIDLTFFSKSYNTEKDTVASIEEFVSPDIIDVKVSDNTTVNGDINKMLCGEAVISLSPSKDTPISKENPISLEFDLSKDEKNSVGDGVTLGTGSDNPVKNATIEVTYIDDGEEVTKEVEVENKVHGLSESNVRAEIDENGNIQIHIGKQVAIKKVTLTITAMQKNNNLAEISKVEFVNGMENRIPDPVMDIPENLTAQAGSEQFTLNWNPCVNVTGYEILVKKGDTVIQTSVTASNSITIQGKEIEDYETYTVSVQSVNGTWKSGYCDSIDVTPKPNKAPDKPDGVGASGIYKGIEVGWKKGKGTQYYNLYYKVRNSDEEYIKIPHIEECNYTISELETLTEYEIYVTGVNELGESPQSIHCSARTTDLNPAEVPKFNLINRDENGVPGSSHIVSVTRNGGSMIDSELDAEQNNTAWGAVDNNAGSYYSKTTWDDGGYNNLGNNGLTYTFDSAYKMDTIALLITGGADPFYARIRWWAEDGTSQIVGASISKMKDSEGRIYYTLKLPYAVTATKIQIGLARYWYTDAYKLITIAETYFYKYDTLMDEIMDLYEDDLHTILKDTVTHETIDELRNRVNTPDEFGEENINKTALLRELETAEKILNDEKLNSSVEIHNGITTVDTGRGFGGLNAWQPLGVSAGSGETITIYVGSNTKRTGEATNLRLILTQYHSESGGVAPSGANLKVGANVITVPKTNSSIGAENGGALYVQYQGNNANEKYAVRVSGGTEVPRLDLYKVTDENERMARAVEYIEALDKYVPEMEALHNKIHKDSGNRNIDYDYDAKNCILGASDILLDTMMLSLPAPQILAGVGNGSTEERAKTLLNGMKSMEDMMYLFYQHKGLNASAPAELDQIPKGHLNIRYQRMFSGAFMYAAGNHIGIEWNETRGMVNCTPVVADEDGTYISGRYFGWGIAHEIGHCINQGSYAVAEITNNYFAQLAKSRDTNESMRFKYDKIYSKVTSGTKGSASDVFTQLGMYWQLHLAYDKGRNYKTYSNYNEQLDNLFYARVDRYSRKPDLAPAPDGIKLTLGDKDQTIMRLACAAANKNVLEFFKRWGKEPDEATIEYAGQFEKETRAIFYANDDSRIYALEGEGSVLGTESSVSAVKDVSVKIGKSANQIKLGFSSADIPESDILGYEVIRCTISGGKVEEIPVGFATGSEFTDTITTINNRAVFYKVTLIDQYLNRSAVFTTEAVKIEHDGSMDKTNWNISTNGLIANEVIDDATEEMPCEQTKSNPAQQAIDHDLETVYTPQVKNNNAEIVIDFNQTLTITGLKYTAGDGMPVGDYEIYVMADNEWLLTANGTFNGSGTVHFANDDDKYISTYSTDAVKLVLLNQENTTVSISEIDVLGVTGDNVDFRKTSEDNTNVIGTLGKDYKYGDNPEDVIPEGSLIFTGAYKGNPAYSTVILYDNDGNIVGGYDEEYNLKAQQIILADVPDSGNIADVSDGTWVYWIEPEQIAEMTMPETVRAELYRVNNALTNEGQRLVSDTLFETVPEELPTIIISAE